MQARGTASKADNAPFLPEEDEEEEPQAPAPAAAAQKPREASMQTRGAHHNFIFALCRG